MHSAANLFSSRSQAGFGVPNRASTPIGDVLNDAWGNKASYVQEEKNKQNEIQMERNLKFRGARMPTKAFVMATDYINSQRSPGKANPMQVMDSN